MKVRIHHIVSVMPTKLDKIRQETKKDANLQLLTQQITEGWPDSIKQRNCSIRPYWSVRHDIAIEDGVLLVGSRILIPTTLRQDILRQIHNGKYITVTKAWRNANYAQNRPFTGWEFIAISGTLSRNAKHAKNINSPNNVSP